MSGMATDPEDEKSSSVDAQINVQNAINYWTSVDSSVNGMLGGFPQVSRIDLQSSSTFLSKLKRRLKGNEDGKSVALLPLALECGAGIGRVTTGMLLGHCQTVDVVEPVKKFTDQLQTDAAQSTKPGRVGRIFNQGLEDFHPEAGRAYNIIWHQWCLGQLSDRDLVAYFVRCQAVLAQEGWIVVKENLSTNADGSDDFDEVDSSVTRSEQKWSKLFQEAGLRLVTNEKQRGFPKELLPVCTWALRPSSW